MHARPAQKVRVAGLSAWQERAQSEQGEATTCMNSQGCLDVGWDGRVLA